ncbi:MAG: phenylacetate--CoA ligase family protein [Pirellulaceae bacterium]|nr:phenylacetate--CoA ligase family protein [Pirellulaceae bacterium]
MIASRQIYQLGLAWRNPSILRRLEFLLESQHWSRAQLQAWQLERLRALVRRAYDKSGFYRDKFDSAGIHPADIRGLDDLVKLPCVSKSELLAEGRRIQLRDLRQTHFYSETSGSTGQPLVFHRNQEWDAWHRASVFRGYSWYGVQPWDRNGYLWGYNFSPWKRARTALLDGLQNRFRLFSYDDQEIRRFARKLRHATFLGGYSSMIYEVAKALNQHGPPDRPLSLKLVKGTSEKIYESYQQEAVAAFGRRITSEYGAAETGIIAFECPSGRMHVNLETCLVESVDQQIVVTNLVSDSFPILRYELGDYIQYDESTRCVCGREHPIIHEVTGRIGKPIFGHQQKYPSLTLYYVFKNLAMEHRLLLNYQAVQHQAGRMELKLEGSLDDDSRQRLRQELRKYFHGDLEVTLTENASLRSTSRKKQDFVTSLA